MTELPILAARDAFFSALDSGPVVVTAPTGSGKSTQVPRWCVDRGRVIVVEPRRVACKTLASRVAELSEWELGREVGFVVRGESRVMEQSQLVFMTPGIALRRFEDVTACDVVIVDELHERALEVDLIVALLKAKHRGALAVMSATLEADRVARYLEATHVRAEGRLFPVRVEHVAGTALLPEDKGLGDRLEEALRRAHDVPGDVLVFLPGKAEIAASAARFADRGFDVIPLHGGLTLKQQARAFSPSGRRKLVLSTNVAETSVTVPGIGVVIDSGLVRRTRYHRGRGFLTLMPVASDSAEQRAGRAGRTGPGVCFRLWSHAARLEPTTPPEIRRESLLPLVLSAAACGVSVEDLSFLDAPADYALEAARAEAAALGAVDAAGVITDTGRELFGLPLDAPLGRLLTEAKERGTLQDAVDLVSVLAVGRPLFRGAPSPLDEDGLRSAGCDLLAAIRAVRHGGGNEPVSSFVIAEARSTAKRLRRAFGVRRVEPDAPINREALVRTALSADPRVAHVARERRGRVTWSNGGTEIELGRESAVNIAENREAIVVLETRAIGTGPRKTKIIATCASPARHRWLVAEGLGRERVARFKRSKGWHAVIERVFARKVIGVREAVPEGPLARQAMASKIAEGVILAEARALNAQRIQDHMLASHLARRGALSPDGIARHDSLLAWLVDRLGELGVERCEDVELLSPTDVTLPEVPYEAATLLEKEYPRAVSTADARYTVELDLEAGEVMLRFKAGKRGSVPVLAALPDFAGLSIRVDTGRGLKVLR